MAFSDADMCLPNELSGELEFNFATLDDIEFGWCSNCNNHNGNNGTGFRHRRSGYVLWDIGREGEISNN